jgi:hypothetical protein
VVIDVVSRFLSLPITAVTKSLQAPSTAWSCGRNAAVDGGLSRIRHKTRHKSIDNVEAVVYPLPLSDHQKDRKIFGDALMSLII